MKAASAPDPLLARCHRAGATGSPTCPAPIDWAHDEIIIFAPKTGRRRALPLTFESVPYGQRGQVRVAR